MWNRVLWPILALPLVACTCGTEIEEDPAITLTLAVAPASGGVDAEGCVSVLADLRVDFTVDLSGPATVDDLELVLSGETSAISSRDDGSPLRISRTPSTGSVTLFGGCIEQECFTASPGERVITLTALLPDEDVAQAVSAGICVR